MSGELVANDDFNPSGKAGGASGLETEALVGDFSDSQSLLASKEAERRRLQEEVEAFLKKGGRIEEVAPNVVADPPKRPESNYGGQPI
ncbi:MAG: hypothetical protein KTR17_00190 [Cellvibrionaceae bacterium]|nr:hypothetical protein [Cellvibrionaceae bacterium]